MDEFFWLSAFPQNRTIVWPFAKSVTYLKSNSDALKHNLLIVTAFKNNSDDLKINPLSVTGLKSNLLALLMRCAAHWHGWVNRYLLAL